MNCYNEIISNKLSAMGISDYGFAKIEPLHTKYTDTLPYSISIAIKLSDAILDEIDSEPTFAYFHHYRTVNAFIDIALLQIGMLIDKEGFRYIPIAASQSIPAVSPYAGLVSHKALARLAGLGDIGKSALFISNKFGTRVRLGTILTNMPFDVCDIADHKDVCGGCNLCVTACPAKAIKGGVWRPGMDRSDIFDAVACSEYMKTAFGHIGRGAVCGICVKTCKKYSNMSTQNKM